MVSIHWPLSSCNGCACARAFLTHLQAHNGQVHITELRVLQRLQGFFRCIFMNENSCATSGWNYLSYITFIVSFFRYFLSFIFSSNSFTPLHSWFVSAWHFFSAFSFSYLQLFDIKTLTNVQFSLQFFICRSSITDSNFFSQCFLLKSFNFKVFHFSNLFEIAIKLPYLFRWVCLSFL